MNGTTGRSRCALHALLGALAFGSFLLFFHNYGASILPAERIRIPPAKMRPYPGAKFGYIYDFDGSEPDRPDNPRSRTELWQDDRLLGDKRSSLDEVLLVGGGRWSHQPGRIVFTAYPSNNDPRTGGQTFTLVTPPLFSRAVGRLAFAVLAASAFGLYWVHRRQPADPPVPASPRSRWRWHLLGACALLLLGLYCNSGTLSPYAITTFPYIDPQTGYAYNPDHIHFRILYYFVDGRGRAVWNHAIFLRRILFNVLAWPFMKVAGFKAGGVLASLCIHAAAFVVALGVLRRRIGERGAVFAAWLLALSPGAAYWGGLPYPYAMIFPGSLLLMCGLLELEEADGWSAVFLSLAMGVAYLGYDLAVYFVPASVLFLLWRRRFGWAALSPLLQLLPLAGWLAILRFGLNQPLENSNTAGYPVILESFSHIRDFAAWGHEIAGFDDIGFDVFFASNFIFLPALFLAAVILNPVTSRIRLAPAEGALLLAALALFLFNNLAPPYTGAWDLRGTWISRLYQPVFPAFVFFLARWWQQMPRLPWARRGLVGAAVALAFAGNALIVFGPIADNPLKLSESAFYRFYDHTDNHWIYEANLRTNGRRPLGFTRPVR